MLRNLKIKHIDVEYKLIIKRKKIHLLLKRNQKKAISEKETVNFVLDFKFKNGYVHTGMYRKGPYGLRKPHPMRLDCEMHYGQFTSGVCIKHIIADER